MSDAKIPFAVYMLNQQDVVGPADWIDVISERLFWKEYDWAGEQFINRMTEFEITLEAEPEVKDEFDFQVLTEEVRRIDEQIMSWAR